MNDNPMHVFTAIGSLAAALTVLVNCAVLIGNTRARRLEMFNSIRGRLQDMERLREESENVELWNETYFNEIEWLSALVLRGDVPQDVFLEHYGPTAATWLRMFKEADLEDPSDPKAFACFKKLIAQIQAPNHPRNLATMTLRIGFYGLLVELQAHADRARFRLSLIK